MVEIQLGTGIAIFGAAFAFWGWVVAWGVKAIREEVRDIKGQAKATADAQITHINQTERRLTMLETEFGYLRRYLAHITDSEEEG